MKRLFIWLLIMVFIGTSVVMSFGCKEEAVEETAEEEVTSVEEEEAEEVVTEEPSDTADEAIELEWWTISHNRNEFDRKIVSMFEEETGIKIKYTDNPSETYRDLLFTAISTGDYPDIMFNWALENTFQYARTGNILELTSYFNENNNEWSNTILASALSAFTDLDGKVWGFPIPVAAKLFYYNKEVFNNLGLEVPKDWDQFIEVCEAIKQSGMTPIVLGNLEAWNGMHLNDILNHKFVGEDVFVADQYLISDAPFTDEGYIESLDALKLLVDNYMNTDPNGVDYATSRVYFYTEEAAMIYDGSWDLGYYMGAGDEVPEEFWEKWDIFLFPDIPGTKGNPNYAHSVSDNGLIVSSQTKYPEAAVEFLKFYSSLENASMFVKEAGEFSSVIGAVNEDTASWALVKMGELLKSAEGSVPWQDIVVPTSLAELLKKEIQAVVGGQKTSEEAMQAWSAHALELKNQQ
jgi:raffinose/stachyose/melibiose transport system substrate-binding protein